MNYEVAVAAVGSIEATMAKSFVIIAGDIAQSWYANLQPGWILSWGDLHELQRCQHSLQSPNGHVQLQTGRKGTLAGLLAKVHFAEGLHSKHN